ncbi:MAG: hypothetical protein V7L02_12430 [Nostoc sp.]|uniref:hypothetical protein n=1 Tax=Nostoc sp. TaxID=1180 RepID=UPI002FF5B87B
MKTNLTEALAILATSPVAKDREAITRLEKVLGEDINTTVQRLANQSVLVESIEFNSIEQSRQIARRLIVSAGLTVSGLSCLAAILFRPNLAIAVTPIAFVTGAAAQSVSLVNEKRSK